MPEEVRTFLDACQFQKTENTRAQNNSSYQKFRGCSPFVLFMNFNKVEGEIRVDLESTYARYMLGCWKSCGLPDEIVKPEKKLLETDARCIWNSLLRLRSEILRFFDGNLYVILDSLDNMYNLIANLPVVDSKELYRQFTRGIAKIFDKNEPRIRTFIFGVSPYLITEFQKYAISCHFIGSEENSVGRFFSYSDASIDRVIKEWKLNISVDECKLSSKFEFNSNVFINPYLCISYLRSLERKGSLFSVNLSPRSLWMKCIFEENDLTILYEVLSGESKKEFAMAVSMHTMCTLSKDSKDRKLYYPLFVFGGFLPCKEETEDDDIYTLFASNESSRILLRFHFELLFLKKFKLPVKQSQDLLKDFLDRNFTEFCVILSDAMSSRSSLMSANEITYHNFVGGFFFHLKGKGFELDNDKDIGPIRPDSVYASDRHVYLFEFKTVKLDKRKRKRSGESLKSMVVNKCKAFVKETSSDQIQKYTPSVSTKYKQNVDIHLMLFYINHVIHVNCAYSFEKCEYSDLEIFSSKSFYTNNDLELIKNVMKSEIGIQ